MHDGLGGCGAGECEGEGISENLKTVMHKIEVTQDIQAMSITSW